MRYEGWNEKIQSWKIRIFFAGVGQVLVSTPAAFNWTFSAPVCNNEIVSDLDGSGPCPQVCFVACVCPNRSGGCCCYGWLILFTLTILNSVPSGACHCFDGGSCGEVTRLKITNMYGIVFVVPVGSKGEAPRKNNEKNAVPVNLDISFKMLFVTATIFGEQQQSTSRYQIFIGNNCCHCNITTAVTTEIIVICFVLICYVHHLQPSITQRHAHIYKHPQAQPQLQPLPKPQLTRKDCVANPRFKR